MQSRLTKILAIVSCLLMPVFVIGVYDFPQDAPRDFFLSAEAWSDDFDHGNITESGWSAQGYGPVYPPWVIEYPANITDADNGTMRGYGPYWNQAWRTSNVAYGSWAFDVYCVANSPANRSYIAFVSGEPVVDPPDFNPPFEYGIIANGGDSPHGNHSFVLYHRPETPNTQTGIGEYVVDDASGWWHINITRYQNSTFNVYFNGTLGITVTDTRLTSSDLFSFYADVGYALDNVAVVPGPEPTTTSTTTTTTTTTTTDVQPPPDLLVIAVIGGGAVAVIVIVVLVRSRSRGLQ